MTQFKWNVSGGDYVQRKGSYFNKDFASEAYAKERARKQKQLHPEWKPLMIRKMELIPDFLPGFGACWYERKQYTWPKEDA